MQVIIKFDGCEEREEYETALNGWKWKNRFEEVWQQCFRPQHKHGFVYPRLNELLAGEHGAAIIEYIDQLEQIYHEINNEE